MLCSNYSETLGLSYKILSPGRRGFGDLRDPGLGVYIVIPSGRGGAVFVETGV